MGETSTTGAGDQTEIEPPTERSWIGAGLTAPLASHLESLGYPVPTALQDTLIPAVFNEADTLIEAPTGAGRTIAVAAIVSELVSDCDPGDSPVALVIAPSDQRCQALVESVQRVGSAIKRSGEAGVRCAIASELGPLTAQAETLATPLDVVVGTPQRLTQLAGTEKLDLSTLEMIVVDQADDIALGDHSEAFTQLLDAIEPDRQRVVMASAVLPPLTDLLATRLKDPQKPTVPTTASTDAGPPQRAFAVGEVSPSTVRTIASALGLVSPVVVVPADQVDGYRDRLVRSGYAAVVTHHGALSELTFDAGATVICTDLPTWTDGYVQLLETAGSQHAAEVILLARPEHRHLLRTFGKSGGVQLNAAPLPSQAGIEAMKLQRTSELVAEQLARVSSQPTPRFLSSVQQLSASYDVADIAAAAMELAHLALQREIQPGDDVPLLLRQPGSRSAGSDRRLTPPAGEASSNRRKGGDRRGKELEPGMTRLFVAAGYNYGVRPGDIVGAFAGESGLSGKEIGNIDIRESFTLVEVPEHLADDVIDAMKTGTIKGRQIEVRRERY
ncbi:MAG: DbpA RNA binding domain-containing protein [Acidimicrobiales bacterium]